MKAHRRDDHRREHCRRPMFRRLEGGWGREVAPCPLSSKWRGVSLMKLTASAGSHARLRYLHSWYQAQFLHSPFADDLAQVPTIRPHPHPQQVHQPAPISLPPPVIQELEASDVERQVDPSASSGQALGDAVMLVQVLSQQVPQSLSMGRGSYFAHVHVDRLPGVVVDASGREDASAVKVSGGR